MDIMFAIRVVVLWVIWLVAPWFFFIPAALIQKHIFGNDPDIWMRGCMPERDIGTLFAGNLFVWFTSYTTAWVVLGISDMLGGKWNPVYPRLSFIATEALRSCGGVATLTLYAWVLVEMQYRGMVPSLYIPENAEAAAAEMPTVLGSLWPWGIVTAFWGDIHFYTTHRLMHTSTFLYNNVHKIHHRSYNTDPFSGLSMHPVEHLIYASVVFLLPFVVAPFAVLPYWSLRSIMFSMIIYPIPGHLGASPLERWHWDHHTKFNWNFGSSPLLDVVFGTDYHSYKERAASKRRPKDIASAEWADRQAEMAKTE